VDEDNRTIKIAFLHDDSISTRNASKSLVAALNNSMLDGFIEVSFSFYRGVNGG